MQLFADSRQMLIAALLTAMAIALSIFETAFSPVLFLPGIKVGLANIVIIIGLYIFPLRVTFLVLMLRIVLSGLLMGTLFSAAFLIGGTGALLSFAAMLLAKRIEGISAMGVSMLGAAAHNAGQIVTASLLINNYALFYYLPFAIMLSVPIGFVTGFIAEIGIKTMQNTNPEL